jgi:VanZ family protein
VERLQNENGIRFYGQGIVFSGKPLVMQEAASSNDSVTVEFLARPKREINNMVPSMITLYDGHREQFIFGQWKKELIIRIPAATADHARYREIGVDNALTTDKTHVVAVTSTRETTGIYIDGIMKKSFRRFSLIPKDRQLSGRLVLGNSPEGTHSWKGSFFGVAIYDRILNGEEILRNKLAWQKYGQPLVSGEAKPVALYLFDEHNGDEIHDHSGAGNNLLIPATFQPLRRIVLGLPDEWFSRGNLMDVTVNILGFVPFGFFLVAWLRLAKNLPAPGVYALSLLIGFCLSLAIELAQTYIPTRDSSFKDVFSNTIGTAAGAFLAQYALPTLHKVKGDSQLIL